MLETRTSKLIFTLNILWIVIAILFLNFDAKVEVQIDDVKLVKSNNQSQTIIVKFNDDDMIGKKFKSSRLELKTTKNKQVTFNVLEFKKMKKNFYLIKIQDHYFNSLNLKNNLYLVLKMNLLNVIYHN